METKLPEILQRYYTAKNAHDVDAMADCFTPDALVHDEKQDIRGEAPIKEWIAKTTSEYRVTVDVKEVQEDGERVKVTANVSGNFDGSPLEMYYDFTLRDGKIAELSIDA